jgi:hypothetical protein
MKPQHPLWHLYGQLTFAAVVGVVNGPRAGKSGLRISVVEAVFLFSKISRPALKRLGRKAGHLHLSSYEVKNENSYTSVCFAGVQTQESFFNPLKTKRICFM